MNLDWAKILQVIQTILAVIGGMVQQPQTPQAPVQGGGQQPQQPQPQGGNVDQQRLRAAVGQHGGSLGQAKQQHVEQAVKSILEAARS